MEATIVYWDILGSYRDNGKENGSYYSILGLYRRQGPVQRSLKLVELARGRVSTWADPETLKPKPLRQADRPASTRHATSTLLDGAGAISVSSNLSIGGWGVSQK